MVVLLKRVILAYYGSHYALFVSAKLRKKWDLSVILRLHSPKIVNAGGGEETKERNSYGKGGVCFVEADMLRGGFAVVKKNC